jgi:hypothetical protein
MIFLTNNRILFFFSFLFLMWITPILNSRTWHIDALVIPYLLIFFWPRPNFRFVPPGHHQNGACVDGLLYDKSRKNKQTKNEHAKQK